MLAIKTICYLLFDGERGGGGGGGQLK